MKEFHRVLQPHILLSNYPNLAASHRERDPDPCDYHSFSPLVYLHRLIFLPYVFISFLYLAPLLVGGDIVFLVFFSLRERERERKLCHRSWVSSCLWQMLLADSPGHDQIINTIRDYPHLFSILWMVHFDSNRDPNNCKGTFDTFLGH